MTKLESLLSIIKNNGSCYNVLYCKNCFFYEEKVLEGIEDCKYEHASNPELLQIAKEIVKKKIHDKER